MITFTLKPSNSKEKAKRLMALKGGIVTDIEVIIELIKLSHENNEPIEFQRWDQKEIDGKKFLEKVILDRETVEMYLASDFNIDFRPKYN